MIPIWFIAIMILAFTWLGYETDWLTVRLPRGRATPVLQNEQPRRKWQFLKYGDDALLLCSNKFCPNYSCPRCKWGSEYAWRIPARTIKLYGSTINFKEGCNYRRAKLLKDIVKAQKSTAPPRTARDTQTCFPLSTKYCAKAYVAMEYFKLGIELLVDGKPIANINGDYKRGMIKDALKPYASKVRIGRKVCILPVGEADIKGANNG